MNWNWQIIIDSLPKLLEGGIITIELVLLSGFLGFLLAVPLALARLSKRWWVQVLPFSYIFFFRGTPLLVQIFLIYYGLSQFKAVTESVLWTSGILANPFWCAIIAFTLNTAAYIAEIIRGAIKSIPKGENEAADAIGMSYGQKLYRIIFPRAFGIMLPAYGNEVIFMLKGSALASTITLMDITGVATTIMSKTYTVLEMFFAAGLIYLALSWIFIAIFRFIEKRINRHLSYTPISKVEVTA
ncbi:MULTISPECIES: ABC transporter permease [unclassified Moraxella]|uniref:ABC transporter permease n=1 Tax=unclassified Moraxella TaxID=2685852 RepID=UPI003AF9F5F4